MDTHSTIISELTSFTAINETEIEVSGSLSGKAVQIIGQLKAVLNDTDRTLVVELEKMERNIVQEFENALQQRIAHDALSLIGKQLMRLKNNYEHLRNLNYYLENAQNS